MSKVVKTDLNKMNGVTTDLVDKLYPQILYLGKSISIFVKDSNTKLSGNSWDAVRQKMNSYLEAIRYLRRVLDLCKNGITDANNGMISFMEDFNEINSDKKDEINSSKSLLNREINSLNWEINKKVKAKDGNEVLQPYYSENQIRNFIKSINNIRYVLIPKHDRLINKINGLDIIDKELFSKLSSIDFSTLRKINDIVTQDISESIKIAVTEKILQSSINEIV